LSGKPSHDCFTTRTGGDGRFAFQGFPTNTSADLAVSKPGKVLRELQREYISPETMRCRAGQQDIKLVVDPGGSIAGKVVTQESSQPLSGVRLWAEGNRPGNVISWQREPALAGADGTFRLADLAAGSYQLRATFGTNPVPEWVAETVSVSVETGQTTHDVQVLATRGGLLEVALLGKADRQPLASASKQNSRSEGTAVTAETGRTNRIEIELNPPPRIAGVVRDPSGTAMPGLALTVFPQWGRSEGEVKTDARGRYELPWDPQRFGGSMQTPYLIARDVGRNLAAAQDIDASTTTLDLRLEPGLVVVGRVEDVHGKPLSNASVRVYLWSGNSGSQFDEKPIRTDAQGRFEATAMPPGRKYSLDATAKGYGSANENIQEDAETNRVELPPCVLKVADHKLAGEVVDTDEKPVARASVYMYGQGQPNGSVRTDDKGRFRFEEVCEGSVQLSVSLQSAYGNARAEAGDTNVVVHLGVNQSFSNREAPKRPSLKGKPLPDLTTVDLGGDAAPAGKPVLLCLFDIEQRPSRRFVKQLAERHDSLQQQGLRVLGLQAAVTTADSFKEWKDANPVPFAVGRLTEKADKTKWASEVDSLPWLILTDGDRRVVAEGFPLDELDAKLKSQAKP
ncbi:MAG: carboxypeptidase regulatory-like domain-containing protein, partial [Verrucomicrobia bacterium]|nr:carboxypeptidase regulatory-like domain-containing protein [Verrucomicrobiota bacterium]